MDGCSFERLGSCLIGDLRYHSRVLLGSRSLDRLLSGSLVRLGQLSARRLFNLTIDDSVYELLIRSCWKLSDRSAWQKFTRSFNLVAAVPFSLCGGCSLGPLSRSA